MGYCRVHNLPVKMGKIAIAFTGIRARIRPAQDATQGFAQDFGKHFRFFILLVVLVTNGAAGLENKLP